MKTLVVERNLWDQNKSISFVDKKGKERIVEKFDQARDYAEKHKMKVKIKYISTRPGLKKQVERLHEIIKLPEGVEKKNIIATKPKNKKTMWKGKAAMKKKNKVKLTQKETKVAEQIAKVTVKKPKASPTEIVKYDEYCVMMKEGDLEPRSLEQWVTSYRKHQKENKN